MAKVQFSDVTPPERRSIRDVPIPGRRKASVSIPKPIKEPSPKVEEIISEIAENKERSAYEYYYPKKEEGQPVNIPHKSRKKPWVYGTAISILIAVFVVGMMTVFASATVNIIPKSQDVQVDTTITASNDLEEGAIRYEIIKLSKSNTVSVPASGEEAGELKASGKIVIYNNFSPEPQRLIVRTRFESPEGLIYRIPESVVIPGKTVKDGVETPGSIEVEVFADEAGEKYNIKKSDFTIPGFKTDQTRYKTLYARSSTEMKGGFVGKMKTVLPADKQAALQNIDSQTETDIKKDLESKISQDMTLLTGSIEYKSAELPPKEEGSSVIIGKEITAYAILLNTEDLSKKITNEYVSKSPDWDGIKPAVKDFSSLGIKNTPANLESGGKINLNISGQARIWASIDTESINQKLLGAPKKEAANLIDEFPGISSVSAAIRPIWKQSFPENPSKIYVQENIAN